MNTIAKLKTFHTKNIVFSLLITLTFSLVNAATIQGQIKNSYGQKIDLRFAISREEHLHGLSGLKSHEFKNNEGMLFINHEMAPRKFWMPDTYFNLDIIFLDTNLKIVGIEKDVMAHPGMKEPPIIAKTETYLAQYILETKAKSLFSKNLKPGDSLTFIGKTSLLEIGSKTRLGQ